MSLPDDIPTYRVEFTDVAEAEAEAVVFWILGRSPERAGRWYVSLKQAASQLSVFPRSHPYVPDRDRYEGEVRRSLYGKGQSAYHLVYRIIEAAEDEDEGVVRVLHVFHAARGSSGAVEDEETTT